MAGAKAFREAYLHADTLDPAGGDYGDFDARRLRYEILWAFYENNAYRAVHAWAQKFKADFGLYKYTRNIYNPATRLANFWQTYLMGGELDPEAGDGREVPSALPIATENEMLRPAIARLWRDSNWQVHKDVLTLRGAVLGDAALRVVDDTRREKVYLRLIHPGTLYDVVLDPQGNVKAYEIREQRADPAGGNRTVTYREVAERDGDLVVYQTYRNNDLYAWDDEQGAEWDEPYGFIPLVVTQHNNVGLDWGWAEGFPALPKIREADDLASKLHDQIRKVVAAPMMLTGASKPATTPAVTGQETSNERPEVGREEAKVLYGPAGADVKFLVAPLDIEHTLGTITEINAELERDYPELKFEILRLSGETSGEALKTAQEPVENKVRQRRPNYDDALRRAQQMAVAIGGFRGYDGYQGFGLESYGAGALDHAIGKRPVFSASEEDKAARDKQLWETVKLARDAAGTAGMLLALRRQGVDDEEIDKIAASGDIANGTFNQFP